MYGIDWDGPISTELDDVECVQVPLLEFPLPDRNLAQLQNFIRPQQESHLHGLDIFLAAQTFLVDSLI